MPGQRKPRLHGNGGRWPRASFLGPKPTASLNKYLFGAYQASGRHASRFPRLLFSPLKGSLLSPTAVSQYYTLPFSRPIIDFTPIHLLTPSSNLQISASAVVQPTATNTKILSTCPSSIQQSTVNPHPHPRTSFLRPYPLSGTIFTCF